MASYTDDQRKAARALYEQRGPKAASEQLRIPPRTIREWAKQEGWAGRLAAVPSGPEHGRAVRLGWAVRKQALADDAAEAASRVLVALNRQLDRGKVYGVLEMAKSFALLTERAAEMSGLGSGVEGLPPDQSAERLDSLLDVLELRVGTDGA